MPYRTDLLIVIFFAAFTSLPRQAHAETYQSHDSLREIAKAFVLQQIQSPPTVPYVEVGALDARLRLSRCEDKLEAFLPSGSRILGSSSVGIRCHSPKTWSLYVPVTVKIFAPVLVASHAMNRGSQITTQDFQSVEVNVASLSGSYLSMPEQILGMTLKHSINAGAVYTPAMLEAPIIVRRGKQVTILAEVAGIEVRMTGKSLMDGSAGALIQVRNLASQRVIEGTVIAEGMVKVTGN
ncbi:MAG: flagellar basal body P-ring formation protein FlgA [Gammaproteobacteria bacterium]